MSECVYIFQQSAMKHPSQVVKYDSAKFGQKDLIGSGIIFMDCSRIKNMKTEKRGKYCGHVISF